MSIFFRSEKKNDQAYCHSFPEYIQYGSCRCHTVYANSIAGFPEYSSSLKCTNHSTAVCGDKIRNTYKHAHRIENECNNSTFISFDANF